jgi:hypothetical protein
LVDHELGSPAREGRIIGYNTPGVLLALRGVAEQGLTEFVHHQEGPLEGLRARLGAFLDLLEGELGAEVLLPASCDQHRWSRARISRFR